MQVMLHAAHAVVDAHIVVVQYDEQVIGHTACIVKAFEGKSAAHASVAYDGHHLPVSLFSVCPLTLTLQFIGHSHSQSS